MWIQTFEGHVDWAWKLRSEEECVNAHGLAPDLPELVNGGDAH